jgi:hypothetical protein
MKKPWWHGRLACAEQAGKPVPSVTNYVGGH